jgi:hypothetical protein
MSRVLATKPATPLDDLHIDEIDEAYRDRSVWVEGGIWCLEAALSIRELRRLDVQLALGFGLRSSQLPRGRNFADWAELTQELNDSPPSLYLWKRGADPIGISTTRVLQLDGLVPRIKNNVRTILSEWHDSTESEFRRTVWIIA